MSDKQPNTIQLYLSFDEDQMQDLFTCLKDVFCYYTKNDDLDGLLRTKSVLERFTMNNSSLFPNDGLF
ncbi:MULTISPECIES: hypothetical protein [Flavobacteriaceae]|uniref:hypothetical protein n=1 Tax=Flavobacteriaceae TaxID=49546 RepID=UPI0010ADD3AC|nr:MULTISPECIES: hypothetical protein [Flavobacteriaceae]NJB38104.1 hypothetical protein [Croceivirga sp. JEA036]TKD59017.1 hypothetical protein FBT53_14630 [Flavobacterium sp. ASW18X]